MNKLPERKKLSHELPQWTSQGVKHFITVNCAKRGESQLISPPVGKALIEGFRVYESLGHWHIWLVVIMPDHIHAILTFNLEPGIKRSLSSWKGFQAKKLGIKWQADFFEHRLRNEQEFLEKAYYVRMNPVRKELTASPEKWEFQIDKTSELAAHPEGSPYRPCPMRVGRGVPAEPC
jgi:REP element-mobilizing transposase RayT